MFLKSACIPALLFVLAAVIPAHAQPRESGGILTDDAGLTIYVFDNDLTVPDKSV